MSCLALRIELEPDGARALAASPHLDAVVELEPRAPGHAVADHLLVDRGLPSDRHVYVRRSELSNAGLARATAAPGVGRLTSLGFESPRLTPAGWRALGTLVRATGSTTSASTPRR